MATTAHVELYSADANWGNAVLILEKSIIALTVIVGERLQPFFNTKHLYLGVILYVSSQKETLNRYSTVIFISHIEEHKYIHEYSAFNLFWQNLNSNKI